jgi:hypothetical protein
VFRSRVPRSAVAAALSIVLIAAFMVGTTSAASSQQASDRAAPAAPKPKPSPTPTPTPVPTPTPTPSPTPNSDNRTVYFGDLHSYPDGDGLLVPSIVTAGNTFAIDIFVENEGNQRLTHSQVGYGSLAVARTDTTDPSLPAGTTIESATLNGEPCTITTNRRGALCDLGQFDSGEKATIQFIVNAPTQPATIATWASFKVAENVPDQGANRNTFYADSGPFEVGPTNSNSNATYKLGNGAFSFSTSGQTLVKKDSMTTTVTVPGDTGAGAISISEEDCDASCVGQIATVHVRNGDDQTPYLEWKLVIIGSIDGVITHELDELDADGNPIEVEISRSCVDVGSDLDVDCIVSNVKNGNATTIVFRTETNGRVKAG